MHPKLYNRNLIISADFQNHFQIVFIWVLKRFSKFFFLLFLLIYFIPMLAVTWYLSWLLIPSISTTYMDVWMCEISNGFKLINQISRICRLCNATSFTSKTFLRIYYLLVCLYNSYFSTFKVGLSIWYYWQFIVGLDMLELYYRFQPFHLSIILKVRLL